MPPTTKKPEGTAHSRRVEYLRDVFRNSVTEKGIADFARHCMKVGAEMGLRVPDKDLYLMTRLRNFYTGKTGGNGWTLDLIEAGLLKWNSPKISANGNGEILPEASKPTPAFLNPSVPPVKPAVPADISFLMESVPKLDAMTHRERHAAINYIRDRYFTDAEA